jgi:hypothetical protein
MQQGHEDESQEGKPQHGEHQAHEQLLAVHLAEYTALTTRGTTFITLGVAVCSIIPLYLAFVGGMWGPAKEIPHGISVLVWGSLLVIQIVLLFALQLQSDQYQIVFYIETKLKKRVHKLVQSENFWEYEGFLRQQRKPQHGATWWEHSGGIGMLVFLIMVAVVFRHFAGLTKWDVAGVGANVVPIVFLFIKSKEAAERRRQWQRAQAGYPI